MLLLTANFAGQLTLINRCCTEYSGNPCDAILSQSRFKQQNKRSESFVIRRERAVA